jgi:hypothetical protein
LPVGLLDEVQEARAYLQAKQSYDAAEKKEHLPKRWPMLEDVKRIDLELAHEAMDARRDHDQR